MAAPKIKLHSDYYSNPVSNKTPEEDYLYFRCITFTISENFGYAYRAEGEEIEHHYKINQLELHKLMKKNYIEIAGIDTKKIT